MYVIHMYSRAADSEPSVLLVIFYLNLPTKNMCFKCGAIRVRIYMTKYDQFCQLLMKLSYMLLFFKCNRILKG